MLCYNTAGRDLPDISALRSGCAKDLQKDLVYIRMKDRVSEMIECCCNIL